MELVKSRLRWILIASGSRISDLTDLDSADPQIPVQPQCLKRVTSDDTRFGSLNPALIAPRAAAPGLHAFAFFGYLLQEKRKSSLRF